MSKLRANPARWKKVIIKGVILLLLTHGALAGQSVYWVIKSWVPLLVSELNSIPPPCQCGELYSTLLSKTTPLSVLNTNNLSDPSGYKALSKETNLISTFLSHPALRAEDFFVQILQSVCVIDNPASPAFNGGPCSTSSPRSIETYHEQ